MVHGSLPRFPVAVPYWQEVGDVVSAARARFGVDVVVLRLLEAEYDDPPGGHVTYLAELTPPDQRVPDAAPWTGRLGPEPRRQQWADPGGPQSAVGWAGRQLDERGLIRV